ncbi:MAG: PDZ domain-containing protein [Firmicutes bacterium]|nr:PDZ domain-containing protein [Bacillota bacterium]
MLRKIILLFVQTFVTFPLNPLFWLLLVLIGIQYRRLAVNESKLFGRPLYAVRQQVINSALFGLAGGLIAGVLLFVLGVPLTEIGMLYVWPLALLLLLVHPRYMCFAYAGGLVGAVAAVVQLAARFWPVFGTGFFAGLAEIHIPGLLALIGTLHLAESILIALSGHLQPSPVWLKTERGIVGGFMLQKFWPLPLVGMMAEVVSLTAPEVAAGTEMPEWWPLFASRLAVGAGYTLMYYLLPVVAGLGYGDLAIASTPREKSRSSARNLGLYSILVLCLALAAERFPVISFAAAVFVPVGHELLILWGNKKEFSRRPLYTAPAAGVGVLALADGGAAQAAGLAPGDVILNINGSPVPNVAAFYTALQTGWMPMQLLVERNGRERLVILDSASDPGIIPVPDRYAPVYQTVEQVNFWQALQKKLKRLRR